jgi:hypothetical protein
MPKALYIAIEMLARHIADISIVNPPRQLPMAGRQLWIVYYRRLLPAR